jgi:serine O-acetyltransferase
LKLSLPYAEFCGYVLRQINRLFPDGRPLRPRDMRRPLEQAVERTAHCFRHVKLPAYQEDGEPRLNHLHSDQYAVFLWFLSNSVWRENGSTAAADKLFYANKTLHGLSCMYDTALPDIFLLLHTTGTVLGKASYSDFFVAAQNVTVGAQNGQYPAIGRNTALLPGSSVIGGCTVGDNVSIGAGAAVYCRDIPDGSVVYRDSGNGRLTIKSGSVPWADRVFRREP